MRAAAAGAGAGAGGRAGGLPAAAPLSGGPGSAPLARPQRPPPCPQLPPPPPSSRWAPRTGRNATSTSRSTGNRVSWGRPRVAECAAGPARSGEERGGADGRPPSAPAVCVSLGVQPGWSALRSRRGHEPGTRLAVPPESLRPGFHDLGDRTARVCPVAPELHRGYAAAVWFCHRNSIVFSHSLIHMHTHRHAQTYTCMRARVHTHK